MRNNRMFETIAVKISLNRATPSNTEATANSKSSSIYVGSNRRVKPRLANLSFHHTKMVGKDFVIIRQLRNTPESDSVAGFGWSWRVSPGKGEWMFWESNYSFQKCLMEWQSLCLHF
ncbi:hypothetical protein CDAR_212811 [Caerostris darwini]|uniref:Uncharacterized protein n=1 Tax=Caerostris darwini TaxID=1538125 RepID=A0AAV4SK73_9ARAC|nr:hypothetical protein CDAR_212811 [Caerostris darwini]